MPDSSILPHSRHPRVSHHPHHPSHPPSPTLGFLAQKQARGEVPPPPPGPPPQVAPSAYYRTQPQTRVGVASNVPYTSVQAAEWVPEAQRSEYVGGAQG